MTITVIGGGVTAMAFTLSVAAQKPLLLSPPKKFNPNRQYALGERALNFLYKQGIKVETYPVNQFQLCTHKTAPLTLRHPHHKPLCHIVSEKNLILKLEQFLSTHNTKEYDTISIPSPGIICYDNQTIKTDLVVVADGANSPLASSLGIYAKKTIFSQTAIVATLSSTKLQNDTAYQWFARQNIIGLLPLGNNFYSLIWSTNTPPPKENVLSELIKKTQIDDLKLIKEEGRFALSSSQLAIRTQPRLAIIGDAAHSIHPLAGQGLNLGLLDAEQLCRCVLRRHDAGNALAIATYARMSGRRSKIIDQLTKQINDSSSIKMNFLLSFAKIPFFDQLAICYANA